MDKLMSNENKQRIIKVMEMVSKDMENDARDFDGQPFNGKTVATYFGNQGAAISAVAKALIEVLKP